MGSFFSKCFMEESTEYSSDSDSNYNKFILETPTNNMIRRNTSYPPPLIRKIKRRDITDDNRTLSV